jgi:crotonobetainyl-CoA:carnitine CoA-transferase CaiB-like acyl-CoA transferase
MTRSARRTTACPERARGASRVEQSICRHYTYVHDPTVSSSPPLEGLKVVDLTRVLAGPFCAMLLGDMGADVIKVEEPQLGDDARGWAPNVGDWSAYFLGVNRSKRSLALDLKSPAGSDVLRRLLAKADVFIENFKPGSLDKLGFGYEAMSALNPRLVYCSITGYGRTGPRRHLSGYDPVVQAESGFMDITGTADGPPVRTGVATSDYLAGLYAFGGILLALRDRDRTGRGQQVDIALFDSVLSTMSMPAGILQATGRNPRRMGNDHVAIAPYETLRAKDGMLMIAAGNPRLWKQLCEAVGAGPLIDDPRFRTNTDRVRNRAALKAELEKAFAVERDVGAVRTRADHLGSAAGSADRAATDVARLRRSGVEGLQSPRQSHQAVCQSGANDPPRAAAR